MRALVVCLGLGTLTLGAAACIAASDGPDDDNEAASAAAALTDNVQFVGGTVIEGAIPPTTDDAVTIAPIEATVIMSPGASSIMALLVEHPEEDTDPIIATLVQFAGDNRHIEVQARTKSPEAQTGVRIENAFSVGEEVCARLCNRSFRVTVTESTKLESGTIGATSTRTTQLDCTEHGSATFCDGSVDDEVQGRDVVEDAGAGIDTGEMSVISAAEVARLVDQMRGHTLVGCGCDGTCDGQLSEEDDAMFTELEDCLNTQVVTEGAEWLKCALDLDAENLRCEQNAACDSIVLDACDQDEEDLCGVMPQQLVDALESCGFVGSGTSGTDQPLDGFQCGDGAVISGAQVCDGTPDCADRSDEAGCAVGMLALEFDCNDGSSVPTSWLCDGTDDCTSGDDELVCQGSDFLCVEGPAPILVDQVCDGNVDCADGGDEAVCIDPAGE